MKNDVSCMGVECPIKNQCLRYTQKSDGKRMRKCMSSKMFLQDENKVNGDSKRR